MQTQSKMSPTFDFTAFLNSPAGGHDPTASFPIASKLSTSASNDFADSLDGFNGGELNDWLSSTDVATPMLEPTKDGLGLAGSYRAGIAAHHASRLNNCIPQPGGAAGGAPSGTGGVGQRSMGGSHSSPSVPLSQATRVVSVKRPSELTIQERRRLTRRGLATGQGVKQPTALRHVLQSPDSTAPNVFSGAEVNANPHHVYSSSGFDLIGALIKVITRPNPKIEIGPVDLSCSFTVSDAKHPDQPIVHCSDTFCQLTGYDRSEIIGRNCRFLQSPDGNVEPGSERSHTDNTAVKHMKKHAMRNQECQTSLINYRRDGTPFINLVTIVPITWGASTEPVFLVGFQADLIEQPGVIIERKPNGLYVANYMNSRQIAEQEEAHAAEAEASKKSILAQELAEIISSGSNETSKWARLLLENSHDMIHVLSLKGTFLYISPSVERILGYKPSEMVGKSISEFCHPSDVVPVFRELKDSTSNASIASAARQWARFDGTVNPPTKGGAGQTGPQVNLIMRMKHKHHGHEWIESVGKLHLEQGKGRKVVISSGRKRPIYNLPWEQARRSLNSRAPGFWYKASTSGIILSTSGSVNDVIEGDSTPSNDYDAPLAGRHFKNVVNNDALQALLRALNSSQVSAIPHLMSNGIGGPSQMVISTIIPSTAGGENLPLVFVYTQRASAGDFATLQQNAVYCQDAKMAATQATQSATLKAGEPSTGSVFSELSTQRSSSWVFEMHQLKNANKRLREEVRAHQRRVSGVDKLSVAIPPQSPSRTKPRVPTIVHSKDSFKSNSHGESGGSSTDISMSPTPQTRSGTGSGSESTAATSVSSGAEGVSAAGMKRNYSGIA